MATKIDGARGLASGYSLRKVESEEEWAAYHGIRRKALFEERGRFGVFQDHHPDELKEGNVPFLLMYGDKPIGTVRVDLRAGQEVVVRMVAMTAEERNKGHGGHMVSLVEAYARKPW